MKSRRFIFELLIFSLFSILLPEPAKAVEAAVNPIETEAYLRLFHQSPKKVMNTALAKRSEDGTLISQPISPLEIEGFSREEMFSVRGEVREKICAQAGRSCLKTESQYSPFAAYTDANQISILLHPDEFPNGYLTSLSAMEEKGLRTSVLEQSPWSDSYWPTYKGLISRRWNFDAFPESKVWTENYQHYLTIPRMMIPVDSLSPAEKYDLLVGDSAFTMTVKNWQQGELAMKNLGKVPSWMGLCHGWAPASFMVPNPQKAVVLPSADGQPITFYPSDIKAIASMSWGEAAPRVKFVGTRCESNTPKEDDVGRVTDYGCFDVNPGTWHIGIVNQIGVAKRSFVMDSTYDYQVWNFPIYSYQYHYFNPQTLASHHTLAGSLTRIEDFTIDKFKSYRSRDARYVAGVAMDVTYVTVQGSSRSSVNEHKKVTVKYVYDLELDGGGKIIGGEWYSNYHPDFLWSTSKESKPISKGEAGLAPFEWDGNAPLPENLRQAALVSSQLRQPLNIILETLIRRSAPDPVPVPVPIPDPTPEEPIP